MLQGIDLSEQLFQFIAMETADLSRIQLGVRIGDPDQQLLYRITSFCRFIDLQDLLVGIDRGKVRFR